MRLNGDDFERPIKPIDPAKQASVSSPAAEPDLISPNDVPLTYESEFGFRDQRTGKERIFADACIAAGMQKKIIMQYIGWKVRCDDIGRTQHSKSGEEHAPKHFAIATNQLRAARETFNRWRVDAAAAGVNVSDVLAQVFAPTAASGLDAEIQRLTRVFVGLETPRSMDETYFDLHDGDRNGNV